MSAERLRSIRSIRRPVLPEQIRVKFGDAIPSKMAKSESSWKLSVRKAFGSVGCRSVVAVTIPLRC
jgi:hypothetical protein